MTVKLALRGLRGESAADIARRTLGITDGDKLAVQALMRDDAELADIPDRAETALDDAEDARDLAQGYASDAAGVSGVNVPSYASRASLAGATVAAAIKQIATRGYAAEGDGGGANYVRTSFATITSAGYPAASYQRSTDRFMPDGSTDATNGGYWLLSDAEPDIRAFGAVTDGSTDDTTALNAFALFCQITGAPTIIKKRAVCVTTDTINFTLSALSYPTIGVRKSAELDLKNLVIRYTGTRDRPAVRISADVSNAKYGDIRLPAVYAFSSPGAPGVSWPGTLTGDDVGVRLIRVRYARIYEQHTYGFTKGIEYVSSNYCSVFGFSVEDCKFGRVWSTRGAAAWAGSTAYTVGAEGTFRTNDGGKVYRLATAGTSAASGGPTGTGEAITDGTCVWTYVSATVLDYWFSNANKVFGGRVGLTSSADALGDAYGDVMTWDKVSSPRGHNNNSFYGPVYEMGGSGASGATYRVPVLIDGVGGFNGWEGCRNENGKGPFAICDGGAADYAKQNVFGVQFLTSGGSVQVNSILEVNSASGNIMVEAGASEHRWSSGPLIKRLTSAGTSGRVYVSGDMFFSDSGGTTASRLTAAASDIFSHKTAALLSGSAGLYTAVDCSRIKAFRVSYSGLTGFQGRLRVVAFDAAGAVLSGTATDATWGNELYVKGVAVGGGSATLSSSGSGYQTAVGTDTNKEMLISVRAEVKTLWIGVTSGGSFINAATGLEIIGYSSRNTMAGNSDNSDGVGAMPIVPVLPDRGEFPLAAANPATAGVHGFYARGFRVGSTVAASGATPGWVCTTAGYLARAWVLSTAYAIVGMTVENDSGKIYELVTAGTSAGSGGPTGTGSAISDGTCVWNYLGVKAVFVAEANLA